MLQCVGSDHNQANPDLFHHFLISQSGGSGGGGGSEVFERPCTTHTHTPACSSVFQHMPKFVEPLRMQNTQH